MAASAIGIFYVGIIGQKLHPKMSTRELMEGPLISDAAHRESMLLSPIENKLLVGHACTRVGILCGGIAAFVLITELQWKWFIAIPLSFILLLISGAILKSIFAVVRLDER